MFAETLFFFLSTSILGLAIVLLFHIPKMQQSLLKNHLERRFHWLLSRSSSGSTAVIIQVLNHDNIKHVQYYRGGLDVCVSSLGGSRPAL